MTLAFRLCVGLLALSAGCAAGRWPDVPRPASAEAVSLRGDTLWTVPVDPQQGPRIVRQLNEARSRLSGASGGCRDQLILARRTAAIGRLREAVAILDRAAAIHFLDPQVYRQRGEFLLRLRELRRARADFEQVLSLTADTTRLPDFLELPNGELVTASSVQFQATLHLGIAHHVAGQHAEAEAALANAMVLAADHDDLTEALLWTGMVSRWTWSPAQAQAILAELEADPSVTAHPREFAALLGLSGALGAGFPASRALGGSADDRALFSLGLATQQLAAGRVDSATFWLDQALQSPNWATVPYLVAEAELARLRRGP